MSQPQVIYWPNAADNTAAIAPIQVLSSTNVGTVSAPIYPIAIQSNSPNMPNVPLADAGNYYVVTNPDGSKTTKYRSAQYYYDNMIRTVSITSQGADYAGVTVTITGLGTPVDTNGNPTATLSVITENNLAGPLNNATVYSANIYARIDSISMNEPGIGGETVSAGFGSTGITAYDFLNLNSNSPQQYACQGQVVSPAPPATDFTYTFYGSLTKPESINSAQGNLITFPEPIPAFAIMAPVTDGSNTLVGNLGGSGVSLATIIWATINDAAADPTTSFYFTLVQQGLHS